MTDFPHLQAFRPLNESDFKPGAYQSWMTDAASQALLAIESQAFGDRSETSRDYEIGQLTETLRPAFRQAVYDYSYFSGRLSANWKRVTLMQLVPDISWLKFAMDITVATTLPAKGSDTPHLKREVIQAQAITTLDKEADPQGSTIDPLRLSQPRLLGVGGVAVPLRWYAPWRTTYEYAGADTALQLREALGRLLCNSEEVNVKAQVDIGLEPVLDDLAITKALYIDTAQPRGKIKSKEAIIPGEDHALRLRVLNTLVERSTAAPSM